MRKRSTALLVALMLLMLCAVPVHAAVNAPDSGPFISRVDVYRHLLEDDDMLVVARYNIPYVSAPDETVSQTYIGRFMNGSTELARVSPYAYYNRGYSYGMFSMYLDSASAPVWDGSYTVELYGSPTLEWLAISASTALTGAVADDGGSLTDETTAANNATVDDMTLLPATPAVNDAYYFGGAAVFSRKTLNIGQQGAGTWTIVWEYRDADGWEAVSGLVDGTNGLRATVGNHSVVFDPPSDWTQTTVSGITAYWLRARVSAYSSITTQPLGTQAWINSGGDPPLVSTGSLSWRATSGTTTTRVLVYSHIVAYAEELGDYWSVALTTSTAGGTVLSNYGEAYFTNAILELRAMCPALFSAGMTVPQYEDATWQKAQSEAIKGTWPFDWGGMSEYVALPSDDEVFRTLIGFGIVFLICAFLMSRTNRADVSLLAGYGLLIVFAVPGWISPVIVGGFAFLALLGVALVFILGKAS